MNDSENYSNNHRGKYCKEITSAIEAGLKAGITIVAICGEVGISEKTFYNWKEKYEEFRILVDSTRAPFERRMLDYIEKKAFEDWRAAKFLLERRYPNEWGMNQKLDLNVNQSNGSAEVISFMKQVKELEKKEEGS
tara:strand:+ start:2846 stop:3253 length:408 start_codon:yes stop_codon:yes gene_type:complete